MSLDSVMLYGAVIYKLGRPTGGPGDKFRDGTTTVKKDALWCFKWPTLVWYTICAKHG